MPHSRRPLLRRFPDFDVLSEKPDQDAKFIQLTLRNHGLLHVQIRKHPGLGEIISPHYELRIGSDTIAFFYQPLACHSYNIVHLHGQSVRVATIDTILSFYLAFLFADRPYYDTTRLLCMAQFLFDVEQANRLAQKGLLRRYSIHCIGQQYSLRDIRAEKAKKFQELRKSTHSLEYEQWFLRYRPTDSFSNTQIKKLHSIAQHERTDSPSSPLHPSVIAEFAPVAV